jgi:acetate kinase
MRCASARRLWQRRRSAMPDLILVVNAGSSSLKFEVFETHGSDRLERRLKGQISGIGTHPTLVAKDSHGTTIIDETYAAEEVSGLPEALTRAQSRLRDRFGGASPVAIGHRVVHGGTRFSAPTLIDDATIAYLEQLVPLAPLHQPNNLAPIKAVRSKAPDMAQVACFDTAFHRTHPETADRFAIPDALYHEGVRRYGFHGLSYEFIAGRLPEVAPDIARGRVVVAHLGSGASMCAMIAGRSVDSTMGFTALDGLPMGTRPGQLDAGVVLYLMREKGMDAKAVEHFLYHDCGLKGLSGVSNDVRDLLGSADPRAAMALDVFTYRIALSVGSLAAAMGGIDGFVFTAGIGENAAPIREHVASRLAWLGLDLDPMANRDGAQRISRPGSLIACHVIPTDEELMIGRHTLATLKAGARRN